MDDILVRLVLCDYAHVLVILIVSFCFQELNAATVKCAKDLYYDPVVNRCENCWSICDFALLQGTSSECQAKCPEYGKESDDKSPKTGQGGLAVEKTTSIPLIILAVLTSAAFVSVLVIGFLKRHTIINKFCRQNQPLPQLPYARYEVQNEEGNEGVHIGFTGCVRAEVNTNDEDVRAPLATAEGSIIDAAEDEDSQANTDSLDLTFIDECPNNRDLVEASLPFEHNQNEIHTQPQLASYLNSFERVESGQDRLLTLEVVHAQPSSTQNSAQNSNSSVGEFPTPTRHILAISDVIHTQAVAGDSCDPVVPGHIPHNEMYNSDSTFAATQVQEHINQEHPVEDPAGVNRNINKHALSPRLKDTEETLVKTTFIE